MYTVNLSKEEVQIIFNALGDLPLKSVVNVFNNIHLQVVEQEQKLTQQEEK